MAYVVRAIEFDCAALPTGSIRILPSHEIRYNRNYTIEDLKSFLDLSKWMHFREPQTD